MLAEERNKVTNKAYVIFIGLCLFALGIAGKILVIQFVDGDRWEQKVARLTTDLREIVPARGNIYADNGHLLATSIPIYEIRMDMRAEALTPTVFGESLDSLAWHLSHLFGDKPTSKYKADLTAAYAKGSRYHLVKSGVEYHQFQQAMEFPLWRQGRFASGVIFEKNTTRRMPYGDLASRTVGYTRDGVAPVGLEGAYNTDLRGRSGQRYEKRLAGGVWMPVKSTNEIEPIDGSDLVTAIDVNIQDVAASALRKQLHKHKARHGCAVLMEVKTGYIVAISNLTMATDSSYHEVYNYAVGEATEPGSTFKLAALMAAFEDGKIELTDSIDTKNGKHRFYDRIMRDSNDKGYGKVDVLTAFQKSSNVGISRIIDEEYRSNPRQFVDRLYKMGLGRSLGLEIGGEGAPKIKDPSDKSWSGVSLPWMSIGYETLMTPLQILTFYNAVANDGVMVKPLFAKEVFRNGQSVRRIEPQVIKQSIASRETIQKAKIMLESVVSEEGTASNLRFGAYSVAGKTGTAQIANDKYGYKYAESVSYQASFVGYFPADRPEYSCIVVVNGPGNDVYYGNQVAGPVFKEISDKVFAQRFDLQREYVEPVTNQVAVHVPVSKSGNASDLKSIFKIIEIAVADESEAYPWVTTKTRNDDVLFERRTMPAGRVPNVLGMGLRDGLFLLEQAGLTVKVTGAGVIKSQSIAPGVESASGKKITIELS
jgi:cell division protein FtsI (penicillin-binding protein 3)